MKLASDDEGINVLHRISPCRDPQWQPTYFPEDADTGGLADDETNKSVSNAAEKQLQTAREAVAKALKEARTRSHEN